jgi:hypothetical protein
MSDKNAVRIYNTHTDAETAVEGGVVSGDWCDRRHVARRHGPHGPSWNGLAPRRRGRVPQGAAEHEFRV